MTFELKPEVAIARRQRRCALRESGKSVLHRRMVLADFIRIPPCPLLVVELTVRDTARGICGGTKDCATVGTKWPDNAGYWQNLRFRHYKSARLACSSADANVGSQRAIGRARL